MTNKKVSIDKDTAKYYLRLESAFTRLCVSAHIDGDKYLEVEGWEREMRREQLFEAWQQCAEKSPYVRKRVTGVQDHTLKSMKKHGT